MLSQQVLSFFRKQQNISYVFLFLYFTKCWHPAILEDFQTLHIPTNKKLEVWAKYRLLLSFFGWFWGKGSFVKINPNKSQACILYDQLLATK